MKKFHLTEQYLAECFENTLIKHRKNDPNLSLHRNVRIGYQEEFQRMPQNEADLICFFGGMFHEVEIKVKLKDFYKDLYCLLFAMGDQCVAYSESKVRKFKQIISGESFVNTFSYLIPSFFLDKISDKQRAYLRLAGIGIIIYAGNGNIETIEKAKRYTGKNKYDTLSLLAYFNRPTINRQAISVKAKKPKRKNVKRKKAKRKQKRKS